MCAEIECCPKGGGAFARRSRFGSVSGIENQDRSYGVAHRRVESLLDGETRLRNVSQKFEKRVRQIGEWHSRVTESTVRYDDETGASELDIGIGESSEKGGT